MTLGIGKKVGRSFLFLAISVMLAAIALVVGFFSYLYFTIGRESTVFVMMSEPRNGLIIYQYTVGAMLEGTEYVAVSGDQDKPPCPAREENIIAVIPDSCRLKLEWKDAKTMFIGIPLSVEVSPTRLLQTWKNYEILCEPVLDSEVYDGNWEKRE